VNRAHRTILASTLVSAALAPAALAQDAAPPAPSLDQPMQTWTLRFEPAAWYVAPSGKLRLPSDTTRGDRVELSDLNMDSPRVSPAGELHLRTSPRWRFSASAAYYSEDSRDATMNQAGRLGDIVFAPGDVLRSELDFFTAELTAAYALVPEHKVNNDADLLFGLDLVFGTRMYNADFSITQQGGADDSDNQFFIEPILGAKAEATLAEHFTIDLQTTFGYLPAGDTESFSWDIIVGFAYRPTGWLGLQIGYRNMFFDLSDGDGAGEFEWEGGVAGLYGGIELRF
jgi:hypothetical protein